MQDLLLELQIGLGGKRMIGIWGVGGSGKTTLASSIYDATSRKFDGSCFIKNVREESSNNGIENLQEKNLCGILQQKKVEVRRVEEGRGMMKDMLHNRKVLIVLDDMDNLSHLEELAGSRDWFGEGSRILITTRDEHVLTGPKVDVIHNITLLNNDEAMKLFCKHAPRGHKRIKDYEQLSKEVVSYAGGLPLALRVLGRFLCDKETNEWRSALARLKEIPDDEMLEKLKISFDGLKPVEKELFLDVACFFRGRYKGELIMMVLDACGFHPVIGIKVLVQKTLITITKNGEFDMHDLVEEMAHYIVRGEHPDNPEKHSRVWKEEDALKICAMDGTMGHAKDYFISIRLSDIDIWRGFALWLDWVKTYNIQLPHDWDNDLSRILMFVKFEKIYPRMIIKLGVDEEFQSEVGHESNDSPETHYLNTYVGYVSFSSLRRHTACLNSTYNIISFPLDNEDLFGDEVKFKVVYVPKGDPMQTTHATTDWSEFWDKKEVYGEKTFTIQQDLNSFIEILWDPGQT